MRDLHNEFPASTHPDMLSIRGATDDTLWHLAAQRGYIIVSKDDDFRQRATLFGPPPKVIWVVIGNSSAAEIATLLRQHYENICSFTADPESAILRLGKA